MVGLGRLERPTSPLSGVRSNHLSYRPAPPPGGVRAAPRQRLRRGRGRACRGEKRNEGGGVPPERPNIRECRPCSKPIRNGGLAEREAASKIVLRKEVIQPQVPLRLPCYDFTPVADPTVAGCLSLLS
jgi:hypothetical protein